MSKEIPIKVDCFGRILTVATSNFIEIYDTRKLIKSVVKEDIPKIKDFYYEPNLSRLYVGCENKLKIYTTEYWYFHIPFTNDSDVYLYLNFHLNSYTFFL